MKIEQVLKKRPVVIRTPDQHLRVFVSSTLHELAEERKAVQEAITRLHLAPIMFESGARPHPAQELYQAYLSQSHIFIGVYWQNYGWIGPGMEISGLEDEYDRTTGLPRLIYIKKPSPNREPKLSQLLERIRDENVSSYKYFTTPNELRDLVENDLILLLSEYFETVHAEEQSFEESSPTTLTNVPIPRNPLIGRQSELENACNLLLREDVALVTLTGPAGTGKSRLGIQIAIELGDQFSDGVFMVPLEYIRDHELVIPTIAKTLNITETASGISLFELIKSNLYRKRILLLIDNFEQVLPAAAQIANLLEACPSLKILVTSRASLHLRAEKELPIPPLEVPPLRENHELEGLSQYAAVELFIQRCQAVKPDFKITNDNASAIAEICQRLDGLPLAIELAAARIKLLTPQLLLSRLEYRFELLKGGTIDLPDRHQTMYRAIDWSYSLLDEDAKHLLQHLAIFRGGWTIDAAIILCKEDCHGRQEILDSLEMLIDNSLLRLPEEISGETRFKMLESIRAFAYDRLLESGDSEIIHQRHAHFYASLAQKAEKEKFGSSEQRTWRIRLEAELDNMRAAMDWALENKQFTCVLRIATGLWRFWWTHGYWREGIRWMEKGLAGLENSDIAIRAKALTRMGWMLDKVGDSPRGLASLEESISLWRQTDNKAGLALALSNLGGIMTRHDLDKSIIMLKEALKIRQGLDHQPGVYATMMNLALALSCQGKNDEAIELYKESLQRARLVHDNYSMGVTLVNLGDLFTDNANFEPAEAYFAEAEQIYQNLGDRAGLADVKRGRGRIALKQGDHIQALNLFSEACDIAFEMDVVLQTIVTLEGIAFAAQKLDDPIKATKLLSACDAIRNKINVSRNANHQADCEAYLNNIRNTIDSATFNTAWNEGSRMSLDQAVKYANQRVD